MAIGFNDGTTQFIPDKGMNFQSTPRVLRHDFGDGYVQRTPNGLNNIPKTFSVSFNNRVRAEIDDIVAYFESLQGATAFNFTYADTNAGGNENTIKVVATSWSRTHSHDNYFSLTATLERQFEP